MARDYYSTLGIGKNATTEDIKKAYRKLALQYHPDRGGSKESEEKFKEVNEAYQVLSDPQKRAQYDQFGDAAFRQGASSHSQGFGGFNGAGGFDFSGFGFGGGLGDIFEDFFGASLSQVQAELQITPAQATLGDKISITVDKENIDFSIPPGTQSGSSFRFPGKGRQMRNGRRGDLIVTITIKTPTGLSKEQRELWEKLKEADKKKRSWF
ncbi:MAG TPA: DnaJ domain-containing protein [bacterium]|nr:DnaJ domain-containing protein [bacterium]